MTILTPACSWQTTPANQQTCSLRSPASVQSATSLSSFAISQHLKLKPHSLATCMTKSHHSLKNNSFSCACLQVSHAIQVASTIVSDIAIFVLKGDVKLQLTNSLEPRHWHSSTTAQLYKLYRDNKLRYCYRNHTMHYVSQNVELERFQTPKLTFNVTESHC